MVLDVLAYHILKYSPLNCPMCPCQLRL